MSTIDKKLAENVARKILEVMKKTANKTINTSNVELYHNGIITVAPTDETIYATVSLSFGSTIRVPNRSGETLAVGDRVKVYSDKQNLADAYIGTKY